MAEQYLPQVREQYEALPYPHRDPKRELEVLLMPIAEQLPAINYYCFGGRRDFSQPFRALVAGGGTGDAAIALAEQLLEFGHRVTYLDISLASMEVAKQRAEMRKLDNIDWVHASILDIPKLGFEKFDYINSSGVLHHLAEPEAGLKALESVLKEDGAMHLMLYAKYGRFGVYLVQDILRILNEDVPDVPGRLENAVSFLNNIPSTNWYINSPPMILNELTMGEAGIYDVLLHPQDRAYTIPELYDFLGSAGLSPTRLFDRHPQFGNLIYEPEIYFVDADMKAKVNAMPLAERQALAELLNSRICRHQFIAKRADKPLPGAESQDFIPFFFVTNRVDLPSLKPEIYEAIKKSTGEYCQFAATDMGLDVNIVFRTHRLMLPILRYLDGERPIREIFRLVMENKDYSKLAPDEAGLTEALGTLLNVFGSHSLMFLRHESLPPFASASALHMRMLERKKRA